MQDLEVRGVDRRRDDGGEGPTRVLGDAQRMGRRYRGRDGMALPTDQAHAAASSQPLFVRAIALSEFDDKSVLSTIPPSSLYLPLLHVVVVASREVACRGVELPNAFVLDGIL